MPAIWSILETGADLQDGVSHQPPAAQVLWPSWWQAGLSANQPLECPLPLLVPTLQGPGVTLRTGRGCLAGSALAVPCTLPSLILGFYANWGSSPPTA